jgi:hypothetical protein
MMMMMMMMTIITTTIIIIIIIIQAKGTEKKLKYKELVYKDTTKVKHVMCHYTSNNWSH